MQKDNYSLIFDLDGTLIDSLPDMHLAILKCLKHFQLRNISIDELKKFVGRGMLNLAEQVVVSCGGEKKIIPHFYEMYRQLYSDNPYEKSRLMDNVIDVLDYFYEKNVIMSVCTNKRQFVADKVLMKSGIKKYFKEVIGAQEGISLKPMPDMIVLLIKRLNINCTYYFVGDTSVDLEAAERASIKSIGVLGGYTNKDLNGLGSHTISNIEKLKLIFP